MTGAFLLQQAGRFKECPDEKIVNALDDIFEALSRHGKRKIKWDGILEAFINNENLQLLMRVADTFNAWLRVYPVQNILISRNLILRLIVKPWFGLSRFYWTTVPCLKWRLIRPLKVAYPVTNAILKNEKTDLLWRKALQRQLSRWIDLCTSEMFLFHVHNTAYFSGAPEGLCQEDEFQEELVGLFVELLNQGYFFALDMEIAYLHFALGRHPCLEENPFTKASINGFDVMGINDKTPYFHNPKWHAATIKFELCFVNGLIGLILLQKESLKLLLVNGFAILSNPEQYVTERVSGGKQAVAELPRSEGWLVERLTDVLDPRARPRSDDRRDRRQWRLGGDDLRV